MSFSYPVSEEWKESSLPLSDDVDGELLDGVDNSLAADAHVQQLTDSPSTSPILLHNQQILHNNNNNNNPYTLFPSPIHFSPHFHSSAYNIIHLAQASPNNGPANATAHITAQADHILNNPNLIVNVWKENLREEMKKIVDIVDDYNYIAMDTEFPGIVARPNTSHKSSDYQYQTLKCNVDILKMIQLGLCFCDSDGNLLPGTCTWQFNFKFSLSQDTYAQDSIDLLTNSGINFAEHESHGITPEEFGELLITSGMVLNEDVKWISFHSGFDFGYLLRIVTCVPLPPSEDEFFQQLKLYFPFVYDIKQLVESINHLHGGLQKVADALGVVRIGEQHQAGSDSFLTAATFFKLKQQYFTEKINPIWSESGFNDKFLGHLFGYTNTVAQIKAKSPLDDDLDDEEIAVELEGKQTSSTSNTPVKPASNFTPISSSSPYVNATPMKSNAGIISFHGKKMSNAPLEHYER